MGIIFEDLKNGVSGGWSLQNGKNFTVEVLATSDDDNPIGPNQIMVATGATIGMDYRWPIVGTAIETVPGCVLQSISSTPRDETGISWTVSFTFGPYNADIEGPINPETGFKNLLLSAPVIRVKAEERPVALMKTRNGDPIQNTAKDPFVGLELPTTDLVFNISHYEEFFPFARLKDFINHLNDAEWNGFPSESLLCRRIEPTPVWSDDLQKEIYNVEYEFVYREDIEYEDSEGGIFIPGWTEMILNCGTRQLIGGEQKPILQLGLPVTEPVLLKEDGTAAEPDDEPIYLSFDILPLADFSTLPFPTDLFNTGA